MKHEITHALQLAFGVGVILGVLLFLLQLQGCGSAQSDTGARAVEIQGPIGTNCFAIVDSTAKVVGGNCLWQR